MPHQVGYIDCGEGQNIGELPTEGSGRSSRGPAISSLSSSPKPSVEELAELKAIMKGDKELSKDKDKGARQKELLKVMMAKKSAADVDGGTSSRSRVEDPGASSFAPVEPPTAEEMTELQAILKDKQKLSDDKNTRARQKELIKMATGKSGSGGASSSAPKKGVRFEDQKGIPTISSADTASGPSDALAAALAAAEGKPSSSRSGAPSSSSSSKPDASSSSSPASPRAPPGSSSGTGDPTVPRPTSSGSTSDAQAKNEELEKKRKTIKYMKMMTVVAAVSILNYTVGFLALLGFLLFLMEEYTDIDGPQVTSPKPISAAALAPSSSLPSSSSSSVRPSSSSATKPSSSSSSRPSSSSGSSSSSSSARRSITEEEKAALPTSTRRKESESEIKPLPPVSMMYLAQPDVKVPGIWKGPDFRLGVQGTTTPLMSSVYGP